MLRSLILSALALLTSLGTVQAQSTNPENEVSRPMIFAGSTGGGCMRPRSCINFAVFTDNSVDVYNFDYSAGRQIVALPNALLAPFLALANIEDLEKLRPTLAAGHCAGCYDGIDRVWDFYERGVGPVSFNSMIVEFPAGHPLFEAASNIESYVWRQADAQGLFD